jgi:hypothetical protein
MAKKIDLGNLIDEIDSSLPKKEKRIKYYKRSLESHNISGGILFSEENKEMNLFQKAYQFLFPINFHSNYDNPLVKVGTGTDMDNAPFNYIKLLDKQNKDLKKVCKEVSKKYGISFLK